LTDLEVKSVEFAFVSACHSEESGRALAKAGISHVVAVRLDSPISDKASQVFARQFYLSLLVRAFSDLLE
jgi:hypothetical protein